MSLFAKVGVKIQDLVAFNVACEKNQVEFREMPRESVLKFQDMRIHAELRDKIGPSYGYLCEADGGYRLVMDSDATYSSLTRRLGANAGRLCRDYTQEVLTQGIRRRGGSINYMQEQPDGSVHLRVSVM